MARESRYPKDYDLSESREILRVETDLIRMSGELVQLVWAAERAFEDAKDAIRGVDKQAQLRNSLLALEALAYKFQDSTLRIKALRDS